MNVPGFMKTPTAAIATGTKRGCVALVEGEPARASETGARPVPVAVQGRGIVGRGRARVRPSVAPEARVAGAPLDERVTRRPKPGRTAAAVLAEDRGGEDVFFGGLTRQ